MSNENLKPPNLSPAKTHSKPLNAGMAKRTRDINANDLSTAETESRGFDPYDTASLFIEKAAKNK